MFKKVITLLFGTAFMVVLMLAALWAVLVFSISPAAIFTLWLAFVAVILLLTRIFIAMVPGYSYEELRAMGYTDYEARRLIRVTNGSMNAI